MGKPGLYFSWKLKGGVALQKYRTYGRPADKQTAVACLKNALHYWDVVVAITRPIYKDMPLVHYTEQNGERAKANDRLRFHWEKLRPDVARDVEIAKNAVQGK